MVAELQKIATIEGIKSVVKKLGKHLENSTDGEVFTTNHIESILEKHFVLLAIVNNGLIYSVQRIRIRKR